MGQPHPSSAHIKKELMPLPDSISERKLPAVWAAMFLISILGMADIPGSVVLPWPVAMNWMVILTICALKATLLSWLMQLGLKRPILRIATLIFIAAYCALCILNALTFLIYDMGITIKLFTVIAQTHISEIREFLPTAFSDFINTFTRPYALIITLLIGGGMVAALCLRVNVGKFRRTVCVISLLGATSLVGVICTIHTGRLQFSVILRTAKGIVQSISEARQMKDYMAFTTDLPGASSVESTRIADVILIVGESASRNHCSLYGYQLATNPCLSRIADSLVIFSNATGSSTLTAKNMKRILTFLSDGDDDAHWSRSPMLFALMKRAGYSTAWFSNQEQTGMWSNPTPAMVKDADEVAFAGGISSDDATMMKHDEILLPYVRKFLDSHTGPLFMGIHLMGSHTEYRKRYPQTYARFTADSIAKIPRGFSLSAKHAATVARYDNSILYSDFVVSRIMSYVASRERPTAVIYFSDHGENVYDNDDKFRGRDIDHVDVPFIIYANARFREQCSGLYSRLERCATRLFSTADICHLVCSLTGTRYSFYRDSLDVSSDAFVENPVIVDGVCRTASNQ